MCKLFGVGGGCDPSATDALFWAVNGQAKPNRMAEAGKAEMAEDGKMVRTGAGRDDRSPGDERSEVAGSPSYVRRAAAPAPSAASSPSGCIFGVVGVLEEGGRFLLIQRSANVRAPGMWCFPGGGIEPGETPAEAIVREMQEEVGLHVEAERELWNWLREDGGLHLRWWQVRRLGGELQPKPDEVQAIAWMTDVQIRSCPGMVPNNLGFLDHYRGLDRGQPGT